MLVQTATTRPGLGRNVGRYAAGMQVKGFFYTMQQCVSMAAHISQAWKVEQEEKKRGGWRRKRRGGGGPHWSVHFNVN